MHPDFIFKYIRNLVNWMLDSARFYRKKTFLLQDVFFHPLKLRGCGDLCWVMVSFFSANLENQAAWWFDLNGKG